PPDRPSFPAIAIVPRFGVQCSYKCHCPPIVALRKFSCLRVLHQSPSCRGFCRRDGFFFG
ncbi:unnamed protein product, partial [Citrullus colocynthis]